jgi:hypothetical protein
MPSAVVEFSVRPSEGPRLRPPPSLLLPLRPYLLLNRLETEVAPPLPVLTLSSLNALNVPVVLVLSSLLPL